MLGKLFLATLQLSAFTFGGGYVIVPLMRKRFVEQYGWISEEEMLNMTAIAQSAPGPIAVNASILVGYRIAGLRGALISMLGTVLPPLVLLSVISMFYTAFATNRIVALVLRGMQAGVAAVIASVVVSMALDVLKLKHWLPVVLMVCSFIAGQFFNVNVIFVILDCALIGLVDTMLRFRRTGR